jgi:DNA repair protein RecO (recombination protein O)
VPAEETSPAIVLRARDYAEADRIVTLLTRDFGKLSGIAKGAKASRKRFERKLEPLSCVTLFFRRRPHGQLVFITRAEPPGESIQPPSDDELTKLALGSYMLEFADALTREEAEAAMAYRVLRDALEVLGLGTPTRSLRHAYELQMLRATGYGLDFEQCRLCRIRVEVLAGSLYFVTARGGIVCSRCRPEAPEGAVRIAQTTAEMLSALSVAPMHDVGTMVPPERDASLVLNRFLTTILDRKLRSIDFLETVI